MGAGAGGGPPSSDGGSGGAGSGSDGPRQSDGVLDGIGGQTVIWGTNIDLQRTRQRLRDFFENFTEPGAVHG